MSDASENNGRVGLTGAYPVRVTGEFRWTEDDEESLRVLKLGGAFGIFMLLAYLAYDQASRGRNAPGTGLHALILGITCLFFGLVWTRAFKRHWRIWIMLYNVALIAALIAISRETQDPESRFIAIMLCPLASASFVSWGTRWQFAMAIMALAGYAAGEYFVPIDSPFTIYRWMGLCAAVVFAQYTAIFIERYRRRLKRQVEDLEEAARFRQTQIATMAHDIRSPVAALSGYVNLLEEEGIPAKERSDLLARIGSTAWNMDLVVSNVLNYYETQDEHLVPEPDEQDPNKVLAEVAEDCSVQARRRRLTLRVDIGPLPLCRFDRRHFERIVRNMLAYSIARMTTGELDLRAAERNEAIVVEVTDNGPPLPSAELDSLFDRPNKNGNRDSVRKLGLYIARVMTEAAGGRITAQFADGRRGLTLVAEFPLDEQPLKAREP
ncbi:MAG: HAMP domain-containing sensor histidine kinase [Candidatus Binatus sp.]